jgi:hypothetical protein
VAVSIRAGRGLYTLNYAAPPERVPGATMLTLAIERADGIERVAFQCTIAQELFAPGEADAPAVLLARLQPWIEREFEQVREAALKTARIERRLHEIRFDVANRGPF